MVAQSEKIAQSGHTAQIVKNHQYGHTDPCTRKRD